jgi:hypothetical protein
MQAVDCNPHSASPSQEDPQTQTGLEAWAPVHFYWYLIHDIDKQEATSTFHQSMVWKVLMLASPVYCMGAAMVTRSFALHVHF